jgi:hypothetical protein
MISDLGYALEQAGFRLVRHIKKTGVRELLVEATCVPETVPLAEARTALERAWGERASFERETHAVAEDEHRIRLDFVSWREGLGGTYVTGRIVVDLDRPAPRLPRKRR